MPIRIDSKSRETNVLTIEAGGVPVANCVVEIVEDEGINLGLEG